MVVICFYKFILKYEYVFVYLLNSQCGLLKQDLPKPSQGLFGSKDRAFLEKSRQLLEGYLQVSEH